MTELHRYRIVANAWSTILPHEPEPPDNRPLHVDKTLEAASEDEALSKALGNDYGEYYDWHDPVDIGPVPEHVILYRLRAPALFPDQVYP